VREVRALAAGTATFGTFGNAPYYLLSDLVQDFRARYPNVRVRLIGQNSSEVADAVRDGHLEAGLIVLPIDDRGLDIEPAIDDELLYLSADPEHTREPMTIERLAEARLILYDARFGWADPTRRQLAERAQRAGVTLEPEIEVEYVEAALDLAVRGLGDTIGARRIALGRNFARRLHSVAFDPPVVDTFAFVTRRNAHLSPATRAFMEIAAKRMEALGRPD
jgi:DNA-binding transcriptional LysR family regulator